MPRVKTVTIQNPTMEQSLQLQSISGSTVHFHASFFRSKVSLYDDELLCYGLCVCFVCLLNILSVS